MERRGISKGPVFLFSSCKCAVILQPRRREPHIDRDCWVWKGEKKKVASLCCFRTKISFHVATKLCLFMLANKNDFCCGGLWDKLRHGVNAWLLYSGSNSNIVLCISLAKYNVKLYSFCCSAQCVQASNVHTDILDCSGGNGSLSMLHACSLLHLHLAHH